MSASKAYLRPNSKRGNLHVLLNTMVSRVVVDPATKTVTGVEYIRNGEKKIVGVKREVSLWYTATADDKSRESERESAG